MLSETSRSISWDRSEKPASYSLIIKSNFFLNPLGENQKKFLNSVLVQGGQTITGSPHPETGFSLKGASGINFSSLSWSGSLFLVSPKSVEGGGGGGGAKERKGGGESKDKSREGSSERRRAIGGGGDGGGGGEGCWH